MVEIETESRDVDFELGGKGRLPRAAGVQHQDCTRH